VRRRSGASARPRTTAAPVTLRQSSGRWRTLLSAGPPCSGWVARTTRDFPLPSF
jgi:hypothetical protein